MNQVTIKKQQLFVLKILWGAMLFSVAMYGFVGNVITTQQKIEVNPIVPTLMYVLGGIGAVFTVLNLTVLERFKDKLNYFIYTILRLVLSEAIGIFGLMLLLLGAGYNTFYGFLGWSVLLMLFAFPSEEKSKGFATSS